MPLVLKQLVLGRVVTVDITATEFADIKEAKRCLLLTLEIEEKLELVLSNYLEFEEDLLKMTLSETLFLTGSWNDYIDRIYKINRRLVNLLSACRLYFDQLQHDVSDIYGSGSSLGVALKAKANAEHAARVGYRVMEALRNHIQHRGLPVESISFPMRWFDDEGTQRSRSTVIPQLNVAKLKEDGKVKVGVIADLEAIGAAVDVRPLVRDYIEAIGAVHSELRSAMAADVQRWDATIVAAIEKYRAAGGDIVGLGIADVDSRGVVAEMHQVFDEFLKRRRLLETKNRRTSHYSRVLIASV